MRFPQLALLLAAALGIGGASEPTTQARKKAVCLESLLVEMIDPQAVARWPQPQYRCLQASSYDRASVAPDKPDWFANIDTGQYIRVETRQGRQEAVMLDAEGPGCLVRWWAGGTTPQMGPPGTVRIYLDGADEPFFTGRFDELLSPEGPVGPPLATIRCIGRNLYLPIPFAKHCKITYDRPPFPQSRKPEDQHWYIIEYRSYPADTPVTTLTMAALREAKPLLDRAGQTLLTPGNQTWDRATFMPAKHARLERGQSLEQSIAGSQAIRRLSVQVHAADSTAALRSTVLVATFDDEQTVWCPIGDFFGSGVGLNSYRDWRREVDRNGLLTCYWVMPFRSSCRLQLLNVGPQPVEATLGAVAYTPWQWDDRSLHFHATWRQQCDIPTKQAAGTTDWNYIQIDAQGLYVGDTLALHNGAGPWWGEGDEKIFVDDERFPSHFGTGSEDYYGYSFGDQGVFFEAPFHAEPRWEGNRQTGFVTVTRSRSLDAIPFRKSLKFDLEIWHWSATKVTYAATTYWYARPGARSNRVPQPEEAVRTLDELTNRTSGR